MFAQTLQPRLSRRRYGNASLCSGEHNSFLVASRTESVIATDHELSVGVSSKEPARNRQNFSPHLVRTYQAVDNSDNGSVGLTHRYIMH